MPLLARSLRRPMSPEFEEARQEHVPRGRRRDAPGQQRGAPLIDIDSRLAVGNEEEHEEQQEDEDHYDLLSARIHDTNRRIPRFYHPVRPESKSQNQAGDEVSDLLAVDLIETGRGIGNLPLTDRVLLLAQ